MLYVGSGLEEDFPIGLYAEGVAFYCILSVYLNIHDVVCLLYVCHVSASCVGGKKSMVVDSMASGNAVRWGPELEDSVYVVQKQFAIISTVYLQTCPK